MYRLEREQWLAEVLQKHQRSVIYSSIFIHSVMSVNDKNVPLIACAFRMKRGKREQT